MSIHSENYIKKFDQQFFIDWYRLNGRDFPWRREEVSPYSILVTEMLLRQTQANSVHKIWANFISNYPNPHILAKANKEVLSNQLEDLGLKNQRTQALIDVAQWLLEHHQGVVPNSLDELLMIPHVGQYTARAVLCFAYGYRMEIVDINILRFFSRYFGIDVKPDIRRNPQIWEIARSILPTNKVKEHNYGLLDFCSLVCKSKSPLCITCDLRFTCNRVR